VSDGTDFEPPHVEFELAPILDARIVFGGTDTILAGGGAVERSTLISGAISFAPQPNTGTARTHTLRVDPSYVGETVTIAVRDNGSETPVEFSSDAAAWRASYNSVEAGRLTLKDVPASGKWTAPDTLYIDNRAPTPVELRVQQTRSGVSLSWSSSDSLSDVVRFKVYRVPRDSAWSAQQIASLPPAAMSFLDTGAHVGNSRYEVIAYDPTGNQSLPLYELYWGRRATVQSTLPRPPETTNDSVVSFPLLIRLRRGVFDFSQAQGNGEDLRFTDERGYPLPFEIERWDSTAGEAEVWVLIDRHAPRSASHPSRHCIVMYWDNPTAESCSRPAAVFGKHKGFEAVWHLTPELHDATGGYQATDSGTDDVDGPAGRCRRFDGGTAIDVGAIDYGGTQLTMSAWVRVDRWSGNDVPFLSQEGDIGRDPALCLGLFNGMLCVNMTTANGSAEVCARRTKLPPRTWLHAAATYDGSMLRLYLDGKEIGSIALKGTIVSDSTTSTVLGGKGFEGLLDEVRIAHTVRTPAWLWLCSHTQREYPAAVVGETRAHRQLSTHPGGAWGPEGPCGVADEE